MSITDAKGNNSGDSKSSKRPWYKKPLSKKMKYSLAGVSVLALMGVFELKTSFAQSFVFNRIAKGNLFTNTRKTSNDNAPPAAGPYDERLGYTRALDIRKSLQNHGFEVKQENEWQDRHFMGMRLFPIYNEKSQAGLKIQDDQNKIIHQSVFPGQVYSDYNAIPPVLVHSLLFVENRELLKEHHTATWNPAVEWERLGNAVLGYGMKKLGGSADHNGGSTLATQTEKFRHSNQGITGSPSEKLRQMLTASVRAYSDDRSTLNNRQKILLDYVNSIPLSAYPKIGEVHGFGDGLYAWFGQDFNHANKLLKKPQDNMSDAELREAAVSYRSALSLLMSVKKPSAYLIKDRQSLEERIDTYLPLLQEAGIISPRFATMVKSVRVTYADPKRPMPLAVKSKSADALQAQLLRDLGMQSIYDLSRMDMVAKTTIDAEVDRAVSQKLKLMTEPDSATAYGLTGFRLLGNAESAKDLVYAFTLYERLPDGRNVLRVQTDNFNGPLNLNEGSKLELGSTAKLRTLICYLEVIGELHQKYSKVSADELPCIDVSKADDLTKFVVSYLATPEVDKSLNGILEAALERKYSASTGERFFTGGGIHTFSNFDRKDNGRNATVKQSFHQSLNLPFVRMLRDIVKYTQYQKMKVDPTLFTNPDHPLRQKYLEDFARKEGSSFLFKFWNEQKGKTNEETASLLASKTRRTPSHLAVVYRTIYPNAPYADFAAFVAKEGNATVQKDGDFTKAFEDYGPGKFDLNDQGYITSIHPLALWLASYRTQHADATWEQTVTASSKAQVEVYKWLFKPNKLGAQNTRIGTMLEEEAFKYIHASWKKNGFPFDKMIPSYASALGASSDKPAALATLAGILQNDGVLKPAIKFYEIDFASNTPYALDFVPQKGEEKRVLPVEITRLVRREMQNVVELGTARRAYNSVQLSDGRILKVGAKTGTGDNRMQTFSKGGGVTASNAKSRTATFVYTIDDRFFGCVTAFVDGPSAGKFKFTSALPALVFKTIAPDLTPLLDRAYNVSPEAIKAAKEKQEIEKKRIQANQNKKSPLPPKSAGEH